MGDTHQDNGPSSDLSYQIPTNDHRREDAFGMGTRVAERRVRIQITRLFMRSARFLAVFDLPILPLQLGTAISVVPDKSDAETGTGATIAKPEKAVHLDL